jgi:hypothetical protein
MKSINEKEETEAESSHERRKFTKSIMLWIEFWYLQKGEFTRRWRIESSVTGEEKLIGFVGVNGDEGMRYETCFGYGRNRY